MRRLTLLFVALCFMAIVPLTHAQEKYAVLITGDYAGFGKGMPTEEMWNSGMERGSRGFDEFWNDTYLMWEMLTEKMEYDPDNVFVLFAGGVDYPGTQSTYAPRYTPDNGVTVTDYPATIGNLGVVFNGLANGTGGFPQVTDDDFLFVWTFDHGGGSNGNSTLHMIDGAITDDDFAALVNPIDAHKKVYWMQQCRSGGFHDELEDTHVFFHAACQPNENAHRANNTPDLENETINDDVYHHGEFNFHTFSPTNQASPTGATSYNGVPYADADLNNDNVMSVYETCLWEQTHENQSETPLVSDPGFIGKSTSLHYPTILYQDLTANQTVHGIAAVTQDVHIPSGVTLTLHSNTHLTLLNNASLIVDPGGTLVIESNVTIVGNTQNEIIVNGYILVGNYVRFIRRGNSGYFQGLKLNNPSGEATMNYVVFDRAKLRNYGSHLSLRYCTFVDCNDISSNNGNVYIQYSRFINNGIKITHSLFSNGPCYVNITGCDFRTIHHFMNAISIENYSNYYLSGNEIDGFYNGIQITNSGAGNGSYVNLYNNNIHDCYRAGIHGYKATVTLKKNQIFDNGYGMWLDNQCDFELVGNSNALSYYQTNYIRDNDSYEIFFSKYSFPGEFHHNAIIDEDNAGNPGDPLLYWNYVAGGRVNLQDVTFNCWGSNFNGSIDLFPGYFIYNPTWCPLGISPLDDIITGKGHEENNDVTATDYYTAKSAFKSVIKNQPETVDAQTAMKSLFDLEVNNQKDFATLKSYLENNQQIKMSEDLVELASKLINRCNIEMENYGKAISYFENQIANPASLQDSIYSIIDLGYLYLRMQEANIDLIGNSPEFKPESEDALAAHRRALLKLLPGVDTKRTDVKIDQDTEHVKFITILPDPDMNSTEVSYTVDKCASIQINVYNSTGQLIHAANEGNKSEGEYYTYLNMNGVPAGIYFYSIIADGIQTDSKKISILK